MAVPDRIGRYAILGKLGEGAMGTVYRGRDDTLDRDVALKVMSRGIADADARARFQREAKAAARLQHPNIIVIYELGEHDGAPFMALEYLDGVDLQQGIDLGIKPDPRFTLPLVLQLLAGLGHAHEHGCIHRDVKPSNVFLPYGQPAKITDFGVARLAGHNVTTSSGAVSGTPSYMAPEQIQGGEIDGRTDLFAAGLILYELVTGEKAFKAETVVAVVYKILYEDANLDLISAGAEWERLRAVIARSIARKPADRYPDAPSMSAALALALEDLGGSSAWSAPSDQALLARPRPARAVPAVPTVAEPRRPARHPAPRPAPRDAAPRARASRAPLALAGALGTGALALLGFAAWLVFAPGETPPSPSPAPSATPEVEQGTASGPAAPPSGESAAAASPSPSALPAPPAAATAASTPAPTPPPTHAPTPAATPDTAPEPPPAPALTLEQRLERANASMAEGRFSPALAEARAVLRDHPTHPEAAEIAQDAEASLVIEECIANARAALDTGDRERALAEVKRGFAINPNDARLVALFREATQD